MNLDPLFTAGFNLVDWKAVWDFTRKSAPIVTALIALLIYLEAKRLRQIEWLAKSITNWQDFNKLLMDQAVATRWAAIREGQVAWSQIDQRDRQIIYAFLNVLVFEFKAARTGVLSRSYADTSVSENILYFHSLWPDLYDHLLRDGWPTDFVLFADKAIARGRRSKAVRHTAKPVAKPAASDQAEAAKPERTPPPHA
ncbi:MAG TPA: hypothetical protein VL358_15715 [Caulobacteraceae bacterium]|nr:hypothetical protein [Caulobacteraceae bacterium]